MFDNPIRVGDLDLGALPDRWRKLDLLFNHAVYVRDTRAPNVMDSRMIDQSRPGGHRLYPTVERYLTAAYDCHTALPALLREHGATQSAMWSLLRCQFEAAFYSLWLLEPEESRDRVLRGVRCEWLDDVQSRRYYNEILTDREFPISGEERSKQRSDQARRNKDHDAVYSSEAQALGVRTSKPDPINVVQELGLMSTNALPGNRVLLRHVWRSLAGLQHGDAGALLRVSDRSVEGDAPGGNLVRLSPSDSAFQAIAGSTALLTTSALVRYLDCHRPTRSALPVDLAHAALVKRRWESPGIWPHRV